MGENYITCQAEKGNEHDAQSRGHRSVSVSALFKKLVRQIDQICPHDPQQRGAGFSAVQ